MKFLRQKSPILTLKSYKNYLKVFLVILLIGNSHLKGQNIDRATQQADSLLKKLNIED